MRLPTHRAERNFHFFFGKGCVFFFRIDSKITNGFFFLENYVYSVNYLEGSWLTIGYSQRSSCPLVALLLAKPSEVRGRSEILLKWSTATNEFSERNFASFAPLFFKFSTRKWCRMNFWFFHHVWTTFGYFHYFRHLPSVCEHRVRCTNDFQEGKREPLYSHSIIVYTSATTLLIMSSIINSKPDQPPPPLLKAISSNLHFIENTSHNFKFVNFCSLIKRFHNTIRYRYRVRSAYIVVRCRPVSGGLNVQKNHRSLTITMGVSGLWLCYYEGLPLNTIYCNAMSARE